MRNNFLTIRTDKTKKNAYNAYHREWGFVETLSLCGMLRLERCC